MFNKYKLIHRNTNEIAIYGDDNTVIFGGPWGAHDEQGKPYYLWVDNSISLDQLKEAKKQQINATRDRLEEGGFLFNGKLFDSDREKSVPRTPADCFTPQSLYTVVKMSVV